MTSITPHTLGDDFTANALMLIANQTQRLDLMAKEKMQFLTEQFSLRCVPCSISLWKTHAHRRIKERVETLPIKGMISYPKMTYKQYRHDIKKGAHEECELFFHRLAYRATELRRSQTICKALTHLPKEISDRVLRLVEEEK